MLSILIPVYNFEVITLVERLHQQGQECSEPFEIICFDDQSDQSFKLKNRKLKDLTFVIYKELPENLGRSRIRNALAEAAQYDYLLFMDCDSKVLRNDYLKNYINCLAPETLIYGGRVYDDHPPADSRFYFHWHYGRCREQVNFKTRQLQAYHAFQTNNFLIPRKVFLAIRFDEQLRQYGHEDTLFGFQLKEREIPIIHIDNPLEHIGLESVDHFLEKSKKGVENLILLEKQYPFIETKLLKAYRWCKRSGTGHFVKWGFKIVRHLIIRNLKSDRPNLRYFDFYKLGLALEFENQDTKI